MNASSVATLAGLGLAILLPLIGWAIYLLYQLRRQTRVGEPQQDQQRQARTSVALLARGALSEQVDLTEACIRIATLLDYLAIEPPERRRWATIYQLSEATAHIPRLQQWHDLTTEQRQTYRAEKQRLEQDSVADLQAPLTELAERFA